MLEKFDARFNFVKTKLNLESNFSIRIRLFCVKFENVTMEMSWNDAWWENVTKS